jgi:hypothetical protein
MFTRIASLVLLTLTLSCQKKPAKSPDQIEPKIKAKAELYKSLHKGWAHQAGCDSLGFTALCKLSNDGCQEADILQAEGEPGRWYRNLGKRCYDDGQSKSDISKDMLMMLFPYLYATGDKQNLREIYDYGKANGNVMGRGPISRTFMTPPMVLLLQRLIGINVSEFPNSSKEVAKAGSEKHLDAIDLLTKGMLGGGLDQLQYEEIRKYADANPKNALFVALYRKYRDGNQQQTIDILLDESLFPSDRLPTSADRCEEYLWQRDNTASDWGPCDRNQTHDGVDFLIAAWVAGQL